jgi:NADH:ubiquinone oxidoreductase subunit H
MSAAQRRKGPEKVGKKGIIQSISDAIKLISKENNIPIKSKKSIYMIAPIITLSISLII